ncbi:hypothetical protein HMF8227_01497 [Saliniradius amylolyticus]|uniref:Uncharacterized protein n=1 Tax=Saliniradius amylolyticus TaxID=2183582 RepID=A0A2S2E375_9ALTE|nr:sulfotransferase [Saliniradius amylolyticus]AWL11972.1 hypothetical protein HMF8227_01497 [Saliniradius amylolyticus]
MDKRSLIHVRLSPNQDVVSLNEEQLIQRLFTWQSKGNWNQLAYVAAQIDPGQPLAKKICGYLFKARFELGDFRALLNDAHERWALGDRQSAVVMAITTAQRYYGQHEEACKLMHELISKGDAQASLYHQYGLLLSELGRRNEALTALNQAIKLAPDKVASYWARAPLVRTLAMTDIEAMIQRFEELPESRNPAPLAYAIGKALEAYPDKRADSFQWYQVGAQKMRDRLSRAAHSEQRELSLLHSVFCSAGTVDIKSPERQQKAKGPIFICGLPRSGTSLLESILATHKQILPRGESLALAQATQHVLQHEGISKFGYQWVNQLDARQWQAIGDNYLERQQAGNNEFITDKMPHNFKSLGIIARALPNARIIHCRRQPRDLYWACFRQLFANGHEYTYDFTRMHQYYQSYRKLMTLWDLQLPGRIYHLDYERLVTQTDAVLQELSEFIGCESDFDWRGFHLAGRPMATLSSEQVRQPLYATGIENWRRFESQLEPIYNQLGLMDTG